jgi:ABC-type transport system involved in cytochrome bd biosynthesis fused ATPase/permease subunit
VTEHYRSPDPHGCGLLLVVASGVVVALAAVGVLTLLGWVLS